MKAALDHLERPGGVAPPIPVPDLSALGQPPRPPAREVEEPRADERPWLRSRFWVLQLIVLALSLIRLAATVFFHLQTTSVAVEFSTLALFLVPVVYAALHYGAGGGIATSGWVSVLAVPRFVTYAGAHEYVAAWAELLQVVLLNALAFLIGQGVSAERAARRLAEAAREAHLSAEALYRELFDSNQAPILFVDSDGYVAEANAAALHAFSAPGRSRPGDRDDAAPVRLVDMIGPEAAAEVLTRLIAGGSRPPATAPASRPSNGSSRSPSKWTDSRSSTGRR